jgi:hypothetical protein
MLPLNEEQRLFHRCGLDWDASGCDVAERFDREYEVVAQPAPRGRGGSGDAIGEASPCRGRRRCPQVNARLRRWRHPGART